MRRCTVLLVAAVAIAAASDAAAQPRERVALVLGGGSARGIAHIGVLRWLDEHRVPVDVVVGTSMGGLMGGVFASGLTPAEMTELVADIDWDRMFLGEAPYEVKTIRRKEDARLYPSRFRFGLKKGLKVPGAIEPGQQIDMLLQGVALPYYDLATFDDLPTPFRCVAVDVRTSEVVVLSDGQLWRAWRATMAIPGIFSPVRIGDRVLVDGGVLNNVPTDVARTFDPGVVIAINVGSGGGATDRTPAESYLGAIMQTMDVMGAATLTRSLSNADIAIRPELDDIGSLDWRRSDLIIQRGYEAAERHRAELLKWAVGDAPYEAWREARQRARRRSPPIPGAITVAGVNGDTAEAIRDRFEPMLGKPVDATTLAQELTTAIGSDRYDTANADFVTDASGVTMNVTMAEKSYGPPFLLTALNLRNAGETQFEVDLGARLVAYDVTGRGSELRLDFSVGTGIDVAGQLYKRLGSSPWFVAGDAAYRRGTTSVFREGEAVAQYRAEWGGVAGEIGVEPNRNSELRLGYVVADVDADVRVGNPILPSVGGRETSLRFRGLYDSMDSPMVPSRGMRVRGDLSYYFGTADVVDVEGLEAAPVRGEIAATTVRAVRRRDRVFASGAAGTTFGDPTYPPYDFMLGGMLRLSAYDPGELRGRNYAVGAVGYLLSLRRLPDIIGGGLYFSSWIEMGSAFNDPGDADINGDVTAGLLAETFLGPVFVGGSVGGDGGRLLITLAPLFR
jgi:NTE family protein